MREVWNGALHRLCLLAAIAVPAMPDPALACSCAQPTVEQAFARSSAVIAGTVTEVEEPFWVWIGLSDSGGHDVTFRVTKRWKGVDAATLTVRTRLTGEACGYPFEVGGAYLVYVAPGPAENLETGICSGTRNLAGADEDVRVLDGLVAGEAAP
ncbi:MAG: hypothetical protein ACKVOI_17550 [Dongiaceae bacterium]